MNRRQFIKNALKISGGSLAALCSLGIKPEEVMAFNPFFSGAKLSSALVFQENWGATPDNTWTSLPSGWNANSSTQEIDGPTLVTSDTAYANGTITTTLSSQYDDFYLIGKVYSVSNISYGAGLWFHLIESDDTAICALKLTYDSTEDEAFRLTAYYNAEGSNTYTSFTAGDHAGLCYWKLEYEKGTGAGDGVVNVYFTDATDYASNGWTNAESVEIATTNDDGQVGKISIQTSDGTTLKVSIDTLWGNTSDINF